MSPDLEALAKRLDRGSWTEREEALRKVRRLAESLPQTALEELLEPRLTALAADSKWEVRRGLARVLGHYRSASARNVIERLWGDDNAQVSKTAQETRKRWTADDRELERRRALEETLPERLRELRDRDPETAQAAEELAFRQSALSIGALAHDLATTTFNLVDLRRRAESLLADTDPREREPFLSGLDRQIDLLNALVQDSRSYAVSANTPSTQTPLRQAVENAVARNQARLEGVTVRLKIGEELAAFVPREPFERALGNLLRNAGEAFEEGQGSVIVRAFEEDEWVVLEVEDDGMGMEDPIRCLQPYASTKKRGGEIHSGLGLPIVRRIVETAGGSLSIHSTLGAGTRVRLQLPRWSA